MAIKLHERVRIVNEAEAKFNTMADEILASLTDGEVVGIIGRYLSILSKYKIRVERHGNTLKSGDEA